MHAPTHPLATVCPCGHPAYTHADQDHIDARRRATDYQWGIQCSGAGHDPITGRAEAHCKCGASREVVIDTK